MIGIITGNCSKSPLKNYRGLCHYLPSREVTESTPVSGDTRKATLLGAPRVPAQLFAGRPR